MMDDVVLVCGYGDSFCYCCVCDLFCVSCCVLWRASCSGEFVLFVCICQVCVRADVRHLSLLCLCSASVVCVLCLHCGCFVCCDERCGHDVCVLCL